MQQNHKYKQVIEISRMKDIKERTYGSFPSLMMEVCLVLARYANFFHSSLK